MAMAEALSNPTLASKSLTMLIVGFNLVQFALQQRQDYKALATAVINLSLGAIAFYLLALTDKSETSVRVGSFTFGPYNKEEKSKVQLEMVGVQLVVLIFLVPITIGIFWSCLGLKGRAISSHGASEGMHEALLKEEERRIAEDGVSYSYDEFQDHFEDKDIATEQWVFAQRPGPDWTPDAWTTPGGVQIAFQEEVGNLVRVQRLVLNRLSDESDARLLRLDSKESAKPSRSNPKGAVSSMSFIQSFTQMN